ncbi:hypothetical protein H9Q13_14500 [Pontibacter sp. JH31]|uniref:WG containing repeat-containing protein n=1 Tax=Pontibacter aquaedesilientis TaxID=2766980 RepID=A0ABR7XJE9_9BACT|nr:hypothetical protein [Pontibacter aquaedesilientis]MBD1398378.1 hypothetical protein [Pontibacter aquaedesilientis]
MPNLRVLLLYLATIAPALLWAQEPQQPVRLELPFEIGTSHLEVIPIPDSSLLVYSKKSNAWLTDATFLIEKFDSQLERGWSAQLDLKYEYEFVRHYTESPYTYLIFQANRPEHYTFVRINNDNGTVRQEEYTLDEAELMHEFNVLQGKYFIIADNRYDQKPVLLYLDPAEKKPLMLPSVYGSESTFSDLLVDPTQGFADVVLTESNGRISRLQVKRFNAKGKLLGNYFILQQENKSLLNAEVTPGDSLSKMLLGTYGARDLRYSQGFFTSPVASQVVSGEFYSFLQLKNFFKYMKPRREERTKKRELARVAAGKEPLHRFRLLLHDLVVTPTGYVLAAEAYYPQYRSGSSYLDPKLRSGERAANAYKRTHAVALGFDQNGVLLWDNTFPLRDVTTPELTHAVEIGHLPGGRFVMVYPEEKKLQYRIMEQDRYSDKETSIELLPYKQDEKITSTEMPGVVRWYGSSFVAFGYQRIRSPKSPSRSVFYINKITF